MTYVHKHVASFPGPAQLLVAGPGNEATKHAPYDIDHKQQPVLLNGSSSGNQIQLDGVKC